MFAFLRSIGLDPIEWSQAIQTAGNPAPFIGEVLENAFSIAQAVVVILTGDDEARLKPLYHSSEDPVYEKEFTPQARPNVLFEAGMAFGSHPLNTILVQIGTIRPFSDVAGRHILRMSDAAEQRHQLAQRLQLAGCAVNTSGNDWYTAGDFSPKNTHDPPKVRADPRLERDQPPFRSPPTEEVAMDGVEVMRVLGQAMYRRGLKTIVGESQFPPAKVQYYLQRLADLGLVEEEVAGEWKFTQKGREFLVQGGFI
jgi:hypothetical protein